MRESQSKEEEGEAKKKEKERRAVLEKKRERERVKEITFRFRDALSGCLLAVTQRLAPRGRDGWLSLVSFTCQSA